MAPKIIQAAQKAFGKIDGLVVNHGTLTPLTRLADTNIEEWRQAYDINVLSAVALVSNGCEALLNLAYKNTGQGSYT